MTDIETLNELAAQMFFWTARIRTLEDEYDDAMRRLYLSEEENAALQAENLALSLQLERALRMTA